MFTKYTNILSTYERTIGNYLIEIHKKKRAIDYFRYVVMQLI